MTELPNGDYLLHAIGDFLTVEGRSMEGDGVLPDVPVTLTRADVLAETDPALEAAVRWLSAR